MSLTTKLFEPVSVGVERKFQKGNTTGWPPVDRQWAAVCEMTGLLSWGTGWERSKPKMISPGVSRSKPLKNAMVKSAPPSLSW